MGRETRERLYLGEGHGGRLIKITKEQAINCYRVMTNDNDNSWVNLHFSMEG